MTYPADTYAESVELTIAASNQLHTILNGDSTTEVAVEDGSKIPSVRKAYTDSLFFLSPQPWVVGGYETVYNQLRAFVEPTGITTWWFSKTATVSTPVLMLSTPHNDTNWTLWNAINNSVYETQKRLAAEAGLNMVGSFLLGATVTTTDDVVFYETDGKYYGWGGTLAKVVPAGSTPTTAGGVGPLLWVDYTYLMLRTEIPNITDVIAQRPSFNALPRLLTALANYNEATNLPINVVGLGSSVGAGASLPDPTTQAPVNYLTAKLKSSLDVGDVFNISSYNYSVNGSTISEYSVPLEQSVTDGHTPKLLVLTYGMNDSGVAIFNAGQTYPAIATNMRNLIMRARELRSDVVVMTTPHHRCSIINYVMPDGISQVYPTTVSAPVAPESLIPPASKSNINGDFTSSGVEITVSARHLRVNQMFRKVAAEFGVPVIDAEYFWFKALEKYGESALFNAGEVLHPNLLGHQQSYQAAIDMFIEGLQRQASQSVDPQLSGNVGINTQSPTAVVDIHVPYTTTPAPSLDVKARLGVVDGNGVYAENTVWRVDQTTGDLVGYCVSKSDSSSIEFYRVHGEIASGSVVSPLEITKTLYGGNVKTKTSGSLNVSGTNTLFDISLISSNGAGKLKVSGFQAGIGRKMYDVIFTIKSGVITLGTPTVVGDNVFTITTSGTLLQLVATASNTNFMSELEMMY